MPEFHFYGSEQDSLNTLQCVLAEGDLEIIPSLEHPTPQPTTYMTVVPELLQALSINRQAFLRGPFSIEPLHFKQLNSGPYAGYYVIDPVRGGPCLTLTLPMCKKLDGLVKHLGPGYLFHPKEYWHIEKLEPIAPSGALKLAYRDLVRRIRSTLVNKRVGRSTLWMGPDAISLLAKAEAIILHNGNWLDKDGGIVKSNLPGKGNPRTIATS